MDLDFGKPGLDNVSGLTDQEIHATMDEMWMKETGECVCFLK